MKQVAHLDFICQVAHLDLYYQWYQCPFLVPWMVTLFLLPAVVVHQTDQAWHDQDISVVDDWIDGKIWIGKLKWKNIGLVNGKVTDREFSE